MSESIQLTHSMREMLDWFGEQDCSCATVGYLADETGFSRETVRSNLKQLAAGGYAEHLHTETALYRLLDDPRKY